VNYLTYLASAGMTGMRCSRPIAVLCMTDPPMVGDLGLLLARRFGAPLIVISEDVFPEIALALGRLSNPVVVGVLRRLVRFYLRRADHVVAIGETMKRRLVAKGTPRERITVIPNWVDTSAIEPVGTVNRWAMENGLGGHFVVMHSGNVGHAQDLETLIDAAVRLGDLDDLAVVLIGSGARKAALEERVARLGLTSVRFLGYQPRELLSETLSSGHVHVIGLGAGLAGYVVPSRAYGVLAAGRPVIVAADEESETSALVREAGCGWAIPPGDPAALADAIREAHACRDELEELGRRGREHVVAHYDRGIAVERYRELLLSLLEGRP
jgi:colanic acid biosynthesis glycosyl transferase WcaI